MKKCIIGIVLSICILSSAIVAMAKDDEEKNSYRLGELYNTGKDNGYSERNAIDEKDPHYGWKLGEFFVTGFSRQILDNNGTPVFLKNTGDEVTLWFDLQQDITALNGDKKLYINEDKNGYENSFQVKKTNLKKGALLIKHTDSQNTGGLSQKHVDYLSAKVSKKANTKVLLCEEGDYEVSLLYEIKDDNFLFFDSYQNYRIDFKFSVRNGNTMVFPFDVLSGQELTNSVFTENGFYIDYANSKYLNVDVKREVLSEGVDGLVEDTRFNRPAKDGEQFTEEGIYTITVTNQYTNVTTEKRIYVGKNTLLKAHVVTGLSISEIQERISDGKAKIDENGNIIPLNAKEDVHQKDDFNKFNTEKLSEKVVITIAVVILLGIIVFLVKKKANSTSKAKEESLENAENTGE